MSKYRINVRFDLDKPKEANAAQYLQSPVSYTHLTLPTT